VDVYEHLCKTNRSLATAAGAGRTIPRSRHSVRTSDRRGIGGRRSNQEGAVRCPRLSSSERAVRLLLAGYSLEEMADVTMAVQHIRRQRLATLERHGWERVDSFFKKVASRVLPGGRKRSKTREKRKFEHRSATLTAKSA
jgi:hypothetical protein